MRGGYRDNGIWIEQFGYEIKLMRIDKTIKQLNKYSDQTTKTNKSSKQTTGTHSSRMKSAIGVTQPSGVASSNVAARMNEYFARRRRSRAAARVRSMSRASR